MVRQSRATRQKQLIQEVVAQTEGFFTAESIATQLERQGIGLATIYRYLAAARKSGVLHSYLCGGRRIYSSAQRNHCHFTCERCKTVEHIDLKRLDFLVDQVEGSICHVQVDITGICKKCKDT